MKLRRTLAMFAVGCLALGACTDDDDGGDDDSTTSEAPADSGAEDGGDDSGGDTASGDTLAAVKAAGVVRCGTRDELPGFSVLEGDDHVGFDADFCRVIAAAVLGDAEAVEYVAL